MQVVVQNNLVDLRGFLILLVEMVDLVVEVDGLREDLHLKLQRVVQPNQPKIQEFLI